MGWDGIMEVTWGWDKDKDDQIKVLVNAGYLDSSSYLNYHLQP